MLQKNRVGFVIVVALVAVAYWYLAEVDSVSQEPQTTERISNDSQPTAFATNVKTRMFRRDGGLNIYFEASRTEYFKAGSNKDIPEEHTIFLNPYATLFETNRDQTNSPTWNIQAAQGHTSDDFIHVELIDDVVIEKPENTHGKAVVKTALLSLETETQIATTRSPTDLQMANSTSHAEDGMIANLKEGSFTLFGARTIYEPQ